MMIDQNAKDKALNQGEIAGCKVLHQDYPVKIPGVPLITEIKHRKAVENNEVIKEICTTTKKIIPGITINRIRWLHNAKGHESRLKAGKKQGTVIVSLPIQALQLEATRKGVVIRAEYFN